MDPQVMQQRLDQISTIWTLVRRAHTGPADDRLTAQSELIERYQKAIYRYLLHLVGYQADIADDLFQDFAVRVVRGDFHGADPSRGRFRDYVKSAIVNLVSNRRQQQARHREVQVDAEQLKDIAAPATADDPFLDCWRKELLDRTWEALAACQESKGPPFYQVLRRRSEHPGLRSSELAEQLTAELNPPHPYTAGAIRKTLERARDRFGKLLLDEVSRSIPTTRRDELESELCALGLLVFCRKALARHR